MPARSMTTAALRHRPGQALLVVVLAAVVSASAALGPLYSRAVEQSIVRTVLSDAPAPDRGVVVAATGKKPPSPDRLASVVSVGKPSELGRPIGGSDVPVTVRTSAGARPQGTARLTSRDGLCGHLRLASGSCPAEAGPPGLVVSQRNAASLGLRVGDPVQMGDGAVPATVLRATVVGIYQPFDASGDYWFQRSAAGEIPAVRSPEAALPVLDTFFTTWQAIDSTAWSERRVHVDLPLTLDRVDLAALPDLARAGRVVDAQARTAGAAASSGLPALVASTAAQRRQTRTVVPLLAVQLALLGVVVLGFVCAAATEARRPEVALARLRGLRYAGTAGLLLRELGTLVVTGSLVGGVLGWAVARLALDRWLAPGVHLELRPPVLLAVAGAAAVGVLAVTVTAAPTLRQPLVSLLRRVPPRASALQVGLVEGGLVAATAAGVVTLLSGDPVGDSGSDRGPVALLAPGLLAVAGGLLLGQAVVPVSGPLARRALRRGRLASGLAGTQVARRPALRRLIAIITVACALLIFAVDTWSVAGRNRDTRAGVQAGAPVVLAVDARDARTLRSAVLAVDPHGRFATPVVTGSTATEDGPRTTAVEPEAFARIARWGSPGAGPGPSALAHLKATTSSPLPLRGDQVRTRITATLRGESDPSGLAVPVPSPVHLLLHVSVGDENLAALVDLGPLRKGTHTYAAALPCTAGCLLRQVEARRTFGDFTTADIGVHVLDLRSGTGATLTPADLGPAHDDAVWQAARDQFGDFPASVDVNHPLNFLGSSYGSSITVQRGDVPVSPPVLTVGDVQARPDVPGSPLVIATAPDLDGADAAYTVSGRLRLVPRSGARGVLVDLGALADSAGPPTSQTAYSVWLADDDRGRERSLVAALARRGVIVTGRDSIADHRRALASEGPTLALRLALLAGVVALVLAAAVLVVGIATSGASRARDLAALRIVGVPARAVRSAAVREHVTVAVLGVMAGVGLGLVAAQVALPQVPIFARAGPRLAIVRDPAWSPVALASAACLLLLVVVAVLVGRALARAATPDRLREGR